MRPIKTKNRIKVLKNLLQQRKDEAIFISKRVNVRYLTGFTGSNGSLLVFAHSDIPSILFTDGRYGEQATIELTDSDCDDATISVSNPQGPKLLEQVGSEVLRHDIRNLLIEASDLTVSTLEDIRTFLATHISTVPSQGIVETLRRKKDDTEIYAIERACEIADQALSNVKGLLLDRVSERDFAIELEYQMMKLGADERSFASIVASGSRSSLPHGHPTQKTITEGDIVVVDFGATFMGYHSDCTRTYSIGEPTAFAAEVFELVSEAQRKVIALTKENALGKTLDETARDVLRTKDLEHRFNHGLGHGVGLEIHEDPFISARNESALDLGYVITVEPGVYIPGELGVRIEDTLVVTKESARALTKIDKDWILT